MANCTLHSSHPATVLCLCTDSGLPLCVSCLSLHLSTPAAHLPVQLSACEDCGKGWAVSKCSCRSISLCAFCRGKHRGERHDVAALQGLRLDLEGKEALERVKTKVEMYESMLTKRFECLQEQYRVEIQALERVKGSLRLEEEGKGVGLEVRENEEVAVIAACLNSGQEALLFSSASPEPQPGLHEALGLTYQSILAPLNPQREDSKLEFSRDWLQTRVLEAMKRHGLEQDKRAELQLLCTSGLQGLCKDARSRFFLNLLLYLQEPVTARTLSAVSQLSLLLLTAPFTEESSRDPVTLAYILTHQMLLPADLESLASCTGSTPPPLIPEIRPDHIRLFSCESLTWGKRVPLLTFPLPGPIRVSNWSASVLLRSGEALICGGHEPRDIADTYRIEVETGVVERLGDMRGPLSCHGLVQYLGWVYSFGGYLDRATLTRAERLSLAQGQWHSLPPMLTPRRCFTPVLLSHFIYLCGGADTHLCERFSPCSDLYTSLPFTLPEDYDTRAVVHGSCLVAFGSRMVTKIDLTNWDLGADLHPSRIQQRRHEEYRTYGVAPACFLGDRVWFSIWEDSSVLMVAAETGQPIRSFMYR